MKVILFGATGMVGQGVLRECLLDPDVEQIISIVRTATGRREPKLRELVRNDFFDFSRVENDLAGYDACFFCLGVSSAGMNEADYRRVTYDIALSAARTLARINPAMTFIYVSGMGTDSSENGSSMWARVKGKTENDLAKLFTRAYAFRPGYIHPMKGVRSKTGWVNAAITVLRPLGFVLKQFHGVGTSSDVLGRAMIAAVRGAEPSHAVESREINVLGAT